MITLPNALQTLAAKLGTRPKWVWGVVGIMLVFSGFVTVNVVRMGAFASDRPVAFGSCLPLLGFPGAEDMAPDYQRGLFYISSDDRAATKLGVPARGAIYALSLDNPVVPSPLQDLSQGLPRIFHPHGMSLYTSPTGQKWLMVVNHPRGLPEIRSQQVVTVDLSDPFATGPTTDAAAPDSVIEIFKVGENGKLWHQRTIKDGVPARINDVLATGPDSFYLTVEGTAQRDSFAESFDSLLARGTGRILHFDGETFSEKASGLAFANSLEMTLTGDMLFASSTLGREVRVYRRVPTTDNLSLAERIPVATGPDNIVGDPSGDLWVAGHPNLFRLDAYLRGRSQTSSTEIWQIDRAKNGRIAPAVRFRDGGELISGGSVAVYAPKSRGLFIGTVKARHILYCQADAISP